MTKYTRTENMAVALKTTDSALLDLFATVGAIRGKSQVEVGAMFNSAFAENQLLAVKLMFYARNIRGGLGERSTFRKMLVQLAHTHPEIVIKNMELIPFFGRYDDLYALVGTLAEPYMWAYLAWTIRVDMEKMSKNEPVSLCAKWLKSINTSSKESVQLARQTAREFGMSDKQYRKTLSSLRNYIRIAERNMSANEWDKIVYSQVPSRAMKNYRKAFQRHDPDGFATYISHVEKGTEKINASTLYPYDILMAAHLGYSYGSRGHFTMDKDAVLEAQWKALPNYIDDAYNVLVMADTSGSMEAENGRPMATSIGLAVYFAERNHGAYKDLFLTFSESPRFVTLHGNTLAEKISHIESIVANTNLEAAFDLILKTAVSNKIAPEDMPKSLIVISDMHFDAATRSYGCYSREENFHRPKTFHQSMQEKYVQAGYEMPTVIYWNVAQRGEAFQVSADDQNVMLVSGQSTSTFKAILNNIGRTPYQAMLEVLNDPMYDAVKV